MSASRVVRHASVPFEQCELCPSGAHVGACPHPSVCYAKCPECQERVELPSFGGICDYDCIECETLGVVTVLGGICERCGCDVRVWIDRRPSSSPPLESATPINVQVEPTANTTTVAGNEVVGSSAPDAGVDEDDGAKRDVERKARWNKWVSCTRRKFDIEYDRLVFNIDYEVEHATDEQWMLRVLGLPPFWQDETNQRFFKKRIADPYPEASFEFAMSLNVLFIGLNETGLMQLDGT